MHEIHNYALQKVADFVYLFLHINISHLFTKMILHMKVTLRIVTSEKSLENVGDLVLQCDHSRGSSDEHCNEG
jgi:hypothetical protein